MILSMTGYGKSSCELADKVLSIEIKSLNSKQVDIYTRLPNLYKEKDLEIRNLISQKLVRGKIECTIAIDNAENIQPSVINASVVRSYYKQLLKLSEELMIEANEDLLSIVMRMPDTLKPEKEELKEEEWAILSAGIGQALQKLNDFRAEEGKALEADFIKRIDIIADLLSQISPFEKQRIEDIRQRIQKNLNEYTEVEKMDENRLEQELIYYLEKLDITEEKVRLRNHLNFFTDVMNNEENNGKKLVFIAQEIGREINTIGSKANQSDIQKLVVMMKDELEKVKEQLMNVL